MNDQELNEKELQVLTEISNGNGGDYSWSDEVEVEGINQNQLKGYISQLTQKGFITSWKEGKFFQLTLTDEGWNLIES